VPIRGAERAPVSSRSTPARVTRLGGRRSSSSYGRSSARDRSRRRSRRPHQIRLHTRRRRRRQVQPAMQAGRECLDTSAGYRGLAGSSRSDGAGPSRLALSTGHGSPGLGQRRSCASFPRGASLGAVKALPDSSSVRHQPGAPRQAQGRTPATRRMSSIRRIFHRLLRARTTIPSGRIDSSTWLR